MSFLPPASTAHPQEHAIVNQRLAFLDAQRAARASPVEPPPDYARAARRICAVVFVLLSGAVGFGMALARKFEPCVCITKEVLKNKPPKS